MKTTHTLAITASAILLGVAAVSYAHPGGGMGMGPGMMGGNMGPATMMSGGMGPGMMGGQQMSAQLAILKTDLKLSPNQEAAWTTLNDAMTSQMAAMQGMHAQMNADTKATTVPDRMAQRSALMQAGLAQMQAMSDTVTGFYGQLNAEQKATFDKFMPMGQGGHPMARR